MILTLTLSSENQTQIEKYVVKADLPFIFGSLAIMITLGVPNLHYYEHSPSSYNYLCIGSSHTLIVIHREAFLTHSSLQHPLYPLPAAPHSPHSIGISPTTEY